MEKEGAAMIGGLDIYWTTNPEWSELYKDSNGNLCERLTDKATPEAIESFKRYCKRMSQAVELEKKIEPGAHVV